MNVPGGAVDRRLLRKENWEFGASDLSHVEERTSDLLPPTHALRTLETGYVRKHGSWI